MRQRSRNARAFRALGVVTCVLAGWGPAAAAGISTSGFAGQVFTLLNQQRAAYGLLPLHDAAALDASAQSYSQVMVQATAGGPVYLSHTGPDGSTLSDRINSAGYTGWTIIGENIAAGQQSPQEVVSAWMSSPGHRANILNPSFQDIGIGIATGPGTWPNGYYDPAVIWWTTDFGSRSIPGGSVTGTSSPPPASAPPPSSPPPSSPPSTSTPTGTTPSTSLPPTGSTPATGSGAAPLTLSLSINGSCGGSYPAGQLLVISYTASSNATLTLTERLPNGSTSLIFAEQPVTAGQSHTVYGLMGTLPGTRTFTLTAAGSADAQATCQVTAVP